MPLLTLKSPSSGDKWPVRVPVVMPDLAQGPQDLSHRALSVKAQGPTHSWGPWCSWMEASSQPVAGEQAG